MFKARKLAEEANKRSEAIEFRLEYPNGKLYKSGMSVGSGKVYYYSYYDEYDCKSDTIVLSDNPKQYVAYETDYMIYLTIMFENGNKKYYHIIKSEGIVSPYKFENPCPSGTEVDYHWSNID